MTHTVLMNGTKIPALGLGCWAIGGSFSAGNLALGYGAADDAEAVKAIHAGLDHGVGYFDTAQAYGAGHSEEILGLALKGRNDVQISTKIGFGIDQAKRELLGEDITPGNLVQGLENSLKRLQRDRLDLVFLHLNDLPWARAEAVFELLERFVDEGKIRSYGWSTDFPDSVEAATQLKNFSAVQHAMNVFFKAEKLFPVVEKHGLLSVNRSPLAMGLLTGKFNASSILNKNDVRSNNLD